MIILALVKFHEIMKRISASKFVFSVALLAILAYRFYQGVANGLIPSPVGWLKSVGDIQLHTQFQPIKVSSRKHIQTGRNVTY